MQFKKSLTAAVVSADLGFTALASVAAPVTTEGTGVGKHGDITVAVTFDNNRIQSIRVVKNAENPVLAQKVFTDMKDDVVARNSADIPVISGATFSSKGFLDAVKEAAKKAGVTLVKNDMKVVKKVVRYVLHLDQNKMDNRKCLSEHPFGTMKRALGQYYFLLKGKLKVTAEMGLFCLSYNLRRAISLKGVPALIASLG